MVHCQKRQTTHDNQGILGNKGQGSHCGAMQGDRFEYGFGKEMWVGLGQSQVLPIQKKKKYLCSIWSEELHLQWRGPSFHCGLPNLMLWFPALLMLPSRSLTYCLKLHPAAPSAPWNWLGSLFLAMDNLFSPFLQNWANTKWDFPDFPIQELQIMGGSHGKHHVCFFLHIYYT